MVEDSCLNLMIFTAFFISQEADTYALKETMNCSYIIDSRTRLQKS